MDLELSASSRYALSGGSRLSWTWWCWPMCLDICLGVECVTPAVWVTDGWIMSYHLRPKERWVLVYFVIVARLSFDHAIILGLFLFFFSVFLYHEQVALKRDYSISSMSDGWPSFYLVFYLLSFYSTQGLSETLCPRHHRTVFSSSIALILNGSQQKILQSWQIKHTQLNFYM